MANLSKDEKKELLEAASSFKLKQEFEVVRKNRVDFKKEFNADTYIKFISIFNKFINHIKKPFKKIEGEFKL
jgi:predicted type IV restriction endonuclease